MTIEPMTQCWFGNITINKQECPCNIPFCESTVALSMYPQNVDDCAVVMVRVIIFDAYTGAEEDVLGCKHLLF